MMELCTGNNVSVACFELRERSRYPIGPQGNAFIVECRFAFFVYPLQP